VERKCAPTTIENATASFMRDIAARNWQDPTQRKFRTLLTDRLHSYATHKGYRYVEQLTLDATTEFRATWKDAPLTAQKNLERLRMFFRFCIDREWIANNPAAKLKVKVQVKEKDPFSPEEWWRIKDAVSLYQDGHGRLGQLNSQELLAFVQVLRHSGLRISDAVKLERSQLVPSSDGDGFGLSVFQQKVQRSVYIPLPDGRHGTDDVVSALRALPAKSEKYFF
jgi:integrase